ncbi:MAG: hypothetical protein GY763_09245 [Gammaproteobacteria bacterium]|nr:hypothetical protein [Gammaproteobacteria bacterium]
MEVFSAPFGNPDEVVYQAGLRLDHIETCIIKCPYAEDSKAHGDAVKLLKTIMRPTSRWLKAIQKDTSMDYVHAYTVISKSS